MKAKNANAIRILVLILALILILTVVTNNWVFVFYSGYKQVLFVILKRIVQI